MPVKQYQWDGTMWRGYGVPDVSPTPGGTTPTPTPVVPTASFVGAPVSGTAPLAVQFTDQSTNATSWSWNFGDGTSSTLRNPSHTYQAGTYTVSLTATNGNGSNTSTRVNYVAAVPSSTSAAQPVGISGSWTMTFQDEFDGATVDTNKWNIVNDPGYTMNKATPNPKNVRVEAGQLILTLNADGTSGMVTSGPVDARGTLKYGFPVGSYVEARVWFPTGSDWDAWWVTGYPWPREGEHDIAEVLSGQLSGGNYHSGGPSYGTTDIPNNGPRFNGYFGSWHVYGLWRKATSAQVYWDGQLIRDYPTTDPGNVQYLVLNKGAGNVTGAASELKVDYVRAWKPGTAPAPTPTPSTGLRATAIATTAPSYPVGQSAFPPDSNRTTLSGAVPTNGWFENWMVGTGQQPINVYPYMLRLTTQGLDMCLPATNPQTRYVQATMLQNLSLRCAETTGSQKLTGHTDLGCTLTWSASSGSMVSNVVRGSAYVTMSYNGLRPVVATQNAILTINGVTSNDGGVFTGTKFKCTLNNGQTWILYATSSVSLTLSGNKTTLTAGGVFAGSLRAAVLPSGTSAETALDAGATAIVTGGTATVSVSGSTATQTFTWTMSGSGIPLIYCLPHHQPKLQSPTYPGLTLTTLRGTMRAVSGATWTLVTALPTVGWDNANPVASARLTAVQTALTSDKTFVPTVSDSYFGPKQLAKSARLACIANVIGDTSARDQVLGNMRTVLNSYLNNQLSTTLRYDTAWGGIVSGAGLTSDQVDFGNGMYNDHHFHYGYVIQAAATVARFDTTWLTAANRAKINDLCRDICNPSTADPYFTPFRHWDWFEGHSWAAGHFEFGDNRNQESTSEAVNGWYAVHLWGLASGNTQLRDLGRWLMAEEIVGAQTYWQIVQASSIYPSPYKENGYVAILWSNKVDANTWFGAQAEYGIGIQMIPTNPTTEALVPSAWMNELWPNNILPLMSRTSVVRAQLLTGGSGYVPANMSGFPHTDGMSASGGSGSGLVFNCNIAGGQIVEIFIVYGSEGFGYSNGETVSINGSGGTGATARIYTQPEDGWKAILFSGYSKINASDAWTRTAALSSWDDGSSKTQHLYHIATQPGA